MGTEASSAASSRRKATIRDVAQRAGVSITTVSHVMNEKGQLSERTRTRVLRAARELDYQADALARGLRQRRIGAIGLVIRALDSMREYAPSGVEIFAQFIAELSGQALSRGYTVTLLPDLSTRPIPALSFALDGYVVVGPRRDDPVTGLLRDRGIPYVCYGRQPGDDGTNWVCEDDRLSARQLLAHLGSGGENSIALLRGTEDDAWNEDYVAEYRAWCEAHGHVERIYASPERDGVAGGAAAAERVFADGAPDALLCLTGRHAAGAQLRLQELGVEIPKQMLIAAGSDSEQTRAARPAITAFHFSPVSTATAILDLLEDRLGGREPRPAIPYLPRLMMRASTRR